MKTISGILLKYEDKINSAHGLGIQDIRSAMEEYANQFRRKTEMENRKFFAGRALGGLLSNSNPDVIDKLCVNGGWFHSAQVVTIVVEIADALIKELDTEKP